MLPPCRKVLQQKIARSNYVSYIWKHVNVANPAEGLDPLKSAWKLHDGKYAIHWYDSDPMPENVSANINDDLLDSDTELVVYSSDESDDE